MSDFYMTLLSNSSMNIYPENKTSTFTVQIPRRVRLEGDWDVALAEIHYPYSFFTVQEGENKLEIKTHLATTNFMDSKGKNIPPTVTTSTLEIRPGFYEDVKEIIKAVNGAIKQATKIVDFFQFDNNSKRVSAKRDNTVQIGATIIASIKLHGRMALQLGFRPEEEISPPLRSPHAANVASGIPDIMLIYCDIIEPQIFGDSCSKLLRTLITSDGSANYFSKPCSIEINQLQYLQLQTKQFDTVRIDLRDISGKLMPFQFGTSSVKLHFKKRS